MRNYKKLILGGLLGTLLSISVNADEYSASEVKVDDGGVVIDLDEQQSLKKLPTVYYNGDDSATLDQTTIYYDADSGVDVMADDVVYRSGNVASGSISLSIDEAEMRAINYSPKFKQALTQKMGAKGRRVGAIGQALPSLGISADSKWSQSRSFEYNYDPYRETLAARNSTGYSLNVSQPLFKGGAIISAIRASSLYDEWVSEDIKTARQAVVKTIRTQYYYTLFSEKLVKIYAEQAEISKEYWEKTKRRYEADDVAEIDVLKYEVQYKIAQANYIKAKSEYDVYRVNILRLIGAPMDSDLTLTTPLDFTEIDPGNSESLTAQALAARPELKASKLNEDLQKENIVQAKSALYPELSAVAGWGQTNRWSSSASNGIDKRGTDWGWSAGFQLNWNVLAGGGQIVRGKIIQAKAILDSYQFATEDTTDMVKEEVKASLLKLLSSIDWVKSQKENVAQAERVLQQETIKWDEGAGDYLDILDARNTLASTQQLYWEGVATYRVSVVNLEYSIGKYQNETDTTVMGYRVVKNKLKKKVVKPKMFSHKSVEDSFKALAVPSDIDDRVKPKEAVNTNEMFNMNVMPAEVDSHVTRKIKPSRVSNESKTDSSNVNGPKLVF